MTVAFRELIPGDAPRLSRFFTGVPVEDRSFLKQDLSDPDAVARHWIGDDRSIRRVAVDDKGTVVAFAGLLPGVERTSHVAELLLVVAAAARRHGLGRALARQMLIEAVRHGFRKVTVDVAADNEPPLRMFRDLGFQPEALLRDHLCDTDGKLHDLVVLAHAVDEHWSGMLTAGIQEALS